MKAGGTAARVGAAAAAVALVAARRPDSLAVPEAPLAATAGLLVGFSLASLVGAGKPAAAAAGSGIDERLAPLAAGAAAWLLGGRFAVSAPDFVPLSAAAAALAAGLPETVRALARGLAAVRGRTRVRFEIGGLGTRIERLPSEQGGRGRAALLSVAGALAWVGCSAQGAGEAALALFVSLAVSLLVAGLAERPEASAALAAAASSTLPPLQATAAVGSLAATLLGTGAGASASATRLAPGLSGLACPPAGLGYAAFGRIGALAGLAAAAVLSGA